MKRKPGGYMYGATVERKKRSQLQLRDLPMNALCNIISRLPIRDAIRTSILSSQWKYVWCDHTNLTFNRYTLMRDCDNTSLFGRRAINELDFIARVDAVLQQHSGIGVNRMEIKCYLRNKHANHIDGWMKFASVSKTKELILQLSDTTKNLLSKNADLYNFPYHFLYASNGSYLQCLHLTSVSLKLPGDFNGFLNLKRLNLVDVNITEEHVEYLLSKCNLLEFLEISCCITLTTIRALHPLNQLKHLQVENCILLKQIEMNCVLSTLEYTGPMVSLKFAATTMLRNVSVRFLTFGKALDYITTGFPSTLPHLQTFNLHCKERERTILPVRPLKFIYLRHLRLELIHFGHAKVRKTDVLDYACLLDAAPFMEKLELHMWMDCHHQPYRPDHGELRKLPSHQHTHLRSVDITGFFGHKDQVELALHILHSSAMLEEMKIDPRVKMLSGGGCYYAVPWSDTYVDGCMIATEFVRGADRRNVVEVAGAPPRMALEATQTTKGGSTSV